MTADRLTRYAILLRAVNVGGTRKVPMAQWRAALEASGATGVRTYLASGNAVIDSPLGAAELARKVQLDLAAVIGVQTEAMVRDRAQVRAAIEANPFPDALAAQTNLHLAFLSAPPGRAAVTAIDHDRYLPDRLAVIGTSLYIWYANGAGRSTVAKVGMPPIGVSATARNWNTVLALDRMLHE